MKKIILTSSSGEHKIWVGNEIVQRITKHLLQDSFPKGKLKQGFIIADQRLKGHVQKLNQGLKAAGWKTHTIFVKASEELKDFRRIYPLYGQLLRAGGNRHSVIFALGGGVIGDVAGFIAGTFLRGIRWVGIPTTLLAQIDSSLGGKTGINHEQGKNLIGVFHQPSVIICDSSFLKTLPRRELVSGLGEMIKYGLLFDPSFFLQLKEDWQKFLILNPKKIVGAIHQCLSWKAKIVTKDELDRIGIREVLNFGHTLGHALEAEAGYGYFRHGEAVILGMRAALHLSVLSGHLSQKVQIEVDTFLGSLPVPPISKKIKNSTLLARLKHDKKSENGITRFVLLKAIGKPVLDRNISDNKILVTLDWLRKGTA